MRGCSALCHVVDSMACERGRIIGNVRRASVAERPVALPLVIPGVAMSQQQENTRSTGVAIPKVLCFRCSQPMRLAIIEPAGVTQTNRDTLVYDCRCGLVHRQPV